MTAAEFRGTLDGDRRALFERLVRQHDASAGRDAAPEHRADRGVVRATAQQEGLWFLDQLSPGTATYNIPVALDIVGPLDLAALAGALDALVERHESLRTRVVARGGLPVLDVDAPRALPLAHDDVTTLPAGERVARAAAIASAEARTPFDLAAGPLARGRVVRLGVQRHVLLLTLHHIVADGWSLGILLRELLQIYDAGVAGRAASLAPLAHSYRDYATSQRDALRGAELDRLTEFWRAHLSGAPETVLPRDRHTAVGAGPGGAHCPLQLDDVTSERLRLLARSERTSAFTALLALLRMALASTSRQSDIVIGAPFAGRTEARFEPVVGYFVNFLPLRSSVGGEDSFRDVLRRERDVVGAVDTHQALPFTLLVQQLRIAPVPGVNPVYQVGLNLMDPAYVPPVLGYGFGHAVGEPIRHGQLTISGMPVESDVAKLPLCLLLWDLPRGFAGVLEYQPALFDRATVVGLCARLARLGEAVCEEPDAPLSRVTARVEAP